MSMLLITGSYQVFHDRPDGDTVSFLPQDPGFWGDVPGPNRVKRNDHGGASLRLDAIDALETHYKGVGPDFAHQPLKLGAHAARDELLKWLGFTEIAQDSEEKVVLSTPDSVPGWILTGGADPFNRCIALVGRGDPPETGDPPERARSGFHLDVTLGMLRSTANHHLLSLGLVYPTFYEGLPDKLRTDLTATAQKARTTKGPDSVWLHDVTTIGAKIESLDSLANDLVILPKLYRRLVDYVRLFGTDLGCLTAFLAGGAEEFTVPERRKPSTVGLQHVVEVIGNTVRMTRPVEELLFTGK